jgi:hypothetical protein
MGQVNQAAEWNGVWRVFLAFLGVEQEKQA